MGWTFFSAKKKDKCETRYVSKPKKIYYSLRTTSKACIDDLVPKKVSSFSRETSPIATPATGESPTSPRCSVSKERTRKATHIRGSSSQSSRKPKPEVLDVLLENKSVQLGDKVSYRGKHNTSGEINREGIKCHCCSVVFSLAAFEKHVGGLARRAAANILLEDGRSLANCLNRTSGNVSEATRKQKSKDKSKDFHFVNATSKWAALSKAFEFTGFVAQCLKCKEIKVVNCKSLSATTWCEIPCNCPQPQIPPLPPRPQGHQPAGEVKPGRKRARSI